VNEDVSRGWGRRVVVYNYNTTRKHPASSGDFVIKLDMESSGAESDDIQPCRME
jgi:hypothetical protein